MDDRLLQYFIDPRTSKILLDIVRENRITVKRLCENNPGTPRSTMYRILNKMEREGFVEVVDYQQKRGTVEKTYSPSSSLKMGPDPNDVSSDDIAVLFMSFCVGFANQFREYALNHPGKLDSRNGVFGYWTAPVYATDRELQVLIENFGQHIDRYSKKDADGDRKLHSIGFIVSPPADDVSGEGPQ